jgi:hypothetical protein
MWMLDVEGDAFKGMVLFHVYANPSGNRYWLRPGQEYSLGRGIGRRHGMAAR